ncbi:cchl [Scenedesmus sp. PABB004]|nr:cchl [Scenedesmus sp. PABB004]
MAAEQEAVRAFVRVAASSAECGSSGSSGSDAGCPVQGAAQASSSGSSGSSGSSSGSPFFWGSGGGGGAAAAAPAACAASAEHASRINMPLPANAPAPAQGAALDTARQRSSIPIAAATPPAHQAPQQGDPGGDTWLYPSQQQFFNAMRRKGWDPQERDMERVVAIHNTVNERAWQHVLAWEALHACDCAEPRLKRFQGKPNEFSPKARLLNLLGFKLPFDRHDWVVDRCGREVRYVIDFYSGPPQPGAPASMHLDVRPALDSPQALADRLRMQFDWVLSGRWRRE